MRLTPLCVVLLAGAVGAAPSSTKKKQPRAPTTAVAPAATVAPEPAPEPATPATPPTATPAPPQGPHAFTVGMPPLRAVSISREEAELYADVLAQRLSVRGLRVLTSSDMATVLGMERQKEVLGCADTGCLVELAGALGFDGLISGSVGKIEGRYSLVVKLIKATSGETLAAFTQQGLSADGLARALARVGWEITAAVAEMPGSTVKRPVDAPPEVLAGEPKAQANLRAWSLLPAGLALGAGGVGISLNVLARAEFDRLAPTQTLLEATSTRNSGVQLQNAEVAAFIASGALLAGAVVMFALGGAESSSAPVAFFDGRGGLLFGWTGRLP